MPIQLSSSNIIINDNGLNECGFLINNTVNNFAPNTSIGDLIIDCDAGKCIHFKTGSSIIPVALTITTSNIGVGTTAPKSNFHIHAGTVQDIRMQLTDSGTGATITDGLILRKDTAHNGYLWNHEPNSSLIFGTNNLEILRIADSGNIGIGTATPTSNFHIHAGTVQDIRMQLTDSGTGATITDGFILRKDTAHNGYLWNHEPNSSLIFGTNNLERLRIADGGNIGIGTATPTSNFHIHAGTVQDIRMQLTDSGTGAMITDGLILRKDTAHNGYLWNHEPNSSLIFGTNNLERLRISNTGAISTNNNSINAGTATITAATFSGNLSGNATSATSATNAQGLTGTPSITVNAITANSINGATINGGNLSGSMYREAPFLYHLYRDSHWGTGSRFIIQTNLLFNEYSRPNLQWRWIIGISTGDTLGWAWGFFCGIYDQYRNAFAVQAIYGGQNITISQNWDAWGGNRCIIDINVSNAHNYINLNIY